MSVLLNCFVDLYQGCFTDYYMAMAIHRCMAKSFPVDRDTFPRSNTNPRSGYIEGYGRY